MFASLGLRGGKIENGAEEIAGVGYGATINPAATASARWRTSKETNSPARNAFAVETCRMSRLRVPIVAECCPLKRAAREIYEGIHRQELLLQVKTRNLASFGGDNTDPDILDMKPGDNFQVLDREQQFNTLTDIGIETFLKDWAKVPK